MRIATFNLENLDEGGEPSLEERIQILRPQIKRLRADVLCFQEIHGQERPNQKRDILALKSLLKDTDFENADYASTETSKKEVYDKRNLVVFSQYPVTDSESVHMDLLTHKIQYNLFTDTQDVIKKIGWERPVLHVKIELPDGQLLHVINVHLKSRIPTDISNQKKNSYAWKTVSGWAEGYFLSSMKRVGQALEVRLLIDEIFENEPDALIVVCGDFNAHGGEVPVEAICGAVENTGNPDLVSRVMLPCEYAIPESLRYTHLHHGQGNLLDHMLVSRHMMKYFSGAEIHNESLHDESAAFARDVKYPESDHAPFIAEFNME